ncbi:MAG: hypothetical protein JXR88_01675 [Clostridia bacterium]|nr:hypothetical protein [Clostridia bacterium]
MDWKRVKTILILAMIFINVLLALQLYKGKTIEEVESIQRDLVLSLLDENQIGYTESLFNINMDIPNVNLKLQTYDFDNSDEVFRKYSDYGQTDVVKTEIIQNKALKFETSTVQYKPIELSDEKFIEMAENLIMDLGFSTKDYQVKSIGETGKKTIIEFEQVIGDFVLRDASMTIKFNNTNLLEFNRVWYDVIGTNTEVPEFITPESALFQLTGQIYDRFPNRKRKIDINDLSLVYQLAQIELMGLTDLVVEGEAYIYWQIETSDGEQYIVNALKE